MYNNKQCVCVVIFKDTGLDVGTDNVPRHVKINADEFTLKIEENWF